MNQWEIWKAKYPYEEDSSIEKERPVIILNVQPLEVLSVKVTSHDVRDADEFDTPIVKWRESGLISPSVARISKTMNLTKDKFTKRYGILHVDDRQNIMKKYMEFLDNIK